MKKEHINVLFIWSIRSGSKCNRGNYAGLANPVFEFMGFEFFISFQDFIF
jgi:hypothetical protein